MKDPRGFLFIVLIGLIFLLSMVSGYKMPLLADIDKDLILMLTPYGIIDFLIATPDHALRPFFFEKPPIRFENLGLILFSIIPIIVVSVWILRFPKEPQ